MNKESEATQVLYLKFADQRSEAERSVRDSIPATKE